MSRITNVAYLLTLVVLASTAGCAAVEPWQRGHLAKPQMALDPNPMQSELRGHTYSAREAASSGGSAKGGGCGCY